MDTARTREGGCLCGGVHYRVTGPMRDIIGCHCSQCRRTTGHYLPATATRLRHFELLEDRGLKWFRASDDASRGFCGSCGATLFWQLDGGDSISIIAGSLDDTSGLTLAAHIFTADKGAYYELDPDVPAFPAGSGGTVPTPE